MRKSLIAAVALAPICLLASQAGATTTISGSVNAPLKTSTANNGAADDLSITGTVTATTTAPVAVTLDSNNSVTNSGTITASNTSGAGATTVGILANGGFTGLVTNGGTINLGSTNTGTSSNNNGVVDAPFVPAKTGDCACNYFGIRLVGASPLVGSVTNSGTITIKGNNSYGISLEAPLVANASSIGGSFSNSGAVTITGDNSIGIRTTASIAKGFLSSSTVSATGTGSQAINIGGPVGGAVSLYGTISATGYAVMTRTSSPTLLGQILNTSADTQQSGGAVVIGANVAGGIYLGGAPSGTVSGSTADLTGDGVADGAETTASIVNYGSKPALAIGSTSTPITIGSFVPAAGSAAASGPAYGIVIRGSVNGAGVYDGKSATGLQIGGKEYDGTVLQGVNVAVGLNVVGSVSASAYNANATGLSIGAGSTVPLLQIGGAVSAAQSYSTYSAFPGVTVTAINLESGASATTLNNTGTISASANATNGQSASVYAVRDQSGSISTVLNEGVIYAAVTPQKLTDTITGKVAALDLSANTSGVTFTQKTNPTPNHAYGDTSGSTHTATTTLTAVTPSITGDILLGSGSNSVNLLNGTITGALDMGSGTGGSLVIDNGATLTGALKFGGAGLAVNVNNGTLDDRNSGSIKVSTLNVGASGSVLFAADPANNRATQFVASGPVTIANGAKFGITLASTPTSITGTQTYVLIQTPSLTMGATSTSLIGSTPYLLNASIASDTTAGTVSLSITPKTAAQMGLNTAEGSALSAIYTNAKTDSEVQGVLLAPTDKTNFLKVYDQMLPDSSGGVFDFSQQTSEAISRATAQADDIEAAGGTREVWAQEFFIGARRDRNAKNVGYDTTGFGMVAGAATGGHGFGVVGATAAFASGTITSAFLPGDTRTAISSMEGGLYWQGQYGALRADARVGAGFSIFEAKRQLFLTDSSGNVQVNRLVKDDRTAWSATGHAGLAYQQSLGRGFYLRPYAHGDYFSQDEQGYVENDPSGKTGFALNVKSRSGSAFSGAAGVAFGGVFGTDIRYRPEFELGYRDAISGDAGKTTAAFKATPNAPFTLAPSDLVSAGVARIALKASTDFYEIGFEANGRIANRYESGSAQFTVRVLF
ncbi:MAG: autotransporter outer membrane beta-barrel domain-containing protein [Pseudomonadota bacterium]|jgi:hypothetical protein